VCAHSNIGNAGSCPFGGGASYGLEARYCPRFIMPNFVALGQTVWA